MKTIKTMSDILSDFIEVVYNRFGNEHKCSRMANEVVIAYTQGTEDEELAEMIHEITKEVNKMLKV